MDYNRIDQFEFGSGVLFQGGTADSSVATFPGPLVIVNMNRGELLQGFIDHKGVVQAIWDYWIDDTPEAVLPDDVLISLVDAIIATLKTGLSVLVKCAAGVSRSSYITIAVEMRANKLSFQQAYLRVRQARPVIGPNSGFVAHLQRLESTLVGA